MPDGLDEYVIDINTGQTVRLPTAYGSMMGLPKAIPRMEPIDYDNPRDATTSAHFLPPLPRGPEQAIADSQERFDQMMSPSPYAGARSDEARIAQTPHAIGTVGQIGKPTELDTPAPTTSGQYATQAELDAATHDQAAAVPPPPAAAPVDPNKPEQAGTDLQRQGNELQEKAVTQTADADARAAGFEEREIAKRNAELDRQRQETARQEAEKQKRFEDLRGNITKKTDEWANYKVDPGRRWKNMSTGRKITAAISVAMTALGDAMQHKTGPNLALEMITKSIDDDIAMQVHDREHLGEVANRARTSLDDYRKEYGDWQQARSARLAEEYKRTADEIERIAAGSKTDRAKANALAMVGDLRTRAGALENTIATSAWNREMKMADVAEQKRQAKVAESQRWTGLSLQKQELDERRKEREQAKNDKLLELSAKSTAEQSKMLLTLGVTDPTTGKIWTDANGNPVIMPTEVEAKDARRTVKDAQTALSAVDELRKQATALGPAAIRGKAADVFNTKLGLLQLQIKEAYKLGTLDKGSVEFLDKLTGGDPTKITAAGVGAMIGIGSESGERVAARLTALGEGIERRALNEIGNPQGVKFQRAEELAPTTANKAAADARSGTPTTAAAVQNEEPGKLAKGLQDFESFVFGTEQQYKKGQRNAEESGGSLRYPGFRADKEQALDTLVAGVKQGDPQAQQRLLEMVGDQKTAGLSNAAMTLIEANAPELLPRALAELPKDESERRAATYRAVDAARKRGGR